MKIRLLLACLVLVPANLAKKIPTGCVTIKSAYNHQYLIASKGESHDEDRRIVTYDDSPQNWLIYRDKGHYRILHNRLLEDLFVSAMVWRGRYVFTWMPKERVENGLWDILPTGGGTFILRNAFYRDCLHTYGSWGWVQAYPECQGKDFEWEIQPDDC